MAKTKGWFCPLHKTNCKKDECQWWDSENFTRQLNGVKGCCAVISLTDGLDGLIKSQPSIGRKLL